MYARPAGIVPKTLPVEHAAVQVTTMLQATAGASGDAARLPHALRGSIAACLGRGPEVPLRAQVLLHRLGCGHLDVDALRCDDADMLDSAGVHGPAIAALAEVLGGAWPQQQMAALPRAWSRKRPRSGRSPEPVRSDSLTRWGRAGAASPHDRGAGPPQLQNRNSGAAAPTGACEEAQDPLICMLQGEALLAVGDCSGAARMLRLAEEKGLRTAACLALLAHCEAGQGRFRAAKARARATLEIDAHQPDMVLLLAECQANVGERQRSINSARHAERLTQPALRSAPQDPALLRRMGAALLLQGRAGEALPYLNRSEQREAGRLDTAMHLCRCYAGLRVDVAQTPTLLARLRGKGKNEPTAQLVIGTYLARRGQSQAALPHLRRALALSEDFVMAQQGLADALLACDHFDEAEPVLGALIRDDAEHLGYRLNLAISLAGQGKKLEAYGVLCQAVADFPGQGGAHCALAHQCMRMGDAAQGLAHFERAYALQPDAPRHARGLGEALVLFGGWAAAEAPLRHALRLEPHVPAIFGFLSRCLFNLGRYSEAEDQLREACRLWPEHAGLRADLTTVLLSQGKHDEAAQQAAQAMRGAPPGSDWRHATGGAQTLQSMLQIRMGTAPATSSTSSPALTRSTPHTQVSAARSS